MREENIQNESYPTDYVRQPGSEFAAKRMGATTYESESSHVPMLSNPNLVLDVISTAAKSVKAG